jgi:hypothetical protein
MGVGRHDTCADGGNGAGRSGATPGGKRSSLRSCSDEYPGRDPACGSDQPELYNCLTSEIVSCLQAPVLSGADSARG